MQPDLDPVVELENRVPGALGFGTSYIGSPVNDLPLEIGQFDIVEFHYSQGPDARGREVEQCGRSQSPGTDDEHARMSEPLLPVDTHVGDDQVAAVPGNFLGRQFACGFDQGR